MRLFVLALLSLSLANSASLTGKWSLVYETQAGERRNTVSIEQTGDSFLLKGDRGTVKGSVSGEKFEVSFPHRSEEAGISSTFKLAGTLEGDTLTGTWSFAEFSGTFKGSRIAETPSSTASAGNPFAGAWTCELQTENQAIPFTIRIDGSTDPVSGKVSIQGREVPFSDGKLDGSTLSFQVSAGNREASFKLTFEGESVKGTWSSQNNSGAVSGKKSS